MDELSKSIRESNYWNDIFMNVTHNINQLIKNEYSDRFLKYPIEVVFELNQDIKNDPNAYAKRIGHKKYEIVIGKKLLTSVYDYSKDIVYKNLVFANITKSNKLLSDKISLIIFYFWMDFICLHEWAHIVRGHCEYVNKEKTYYEFNINSKEDSSTNNLYFEIDADKFSTRYFTGKFSLCIDQIKEIGILDDNIIMLEIMTSMLYLFDLFSQLHDGNKIGSHPLPINRIVVFVSAVIETVNLKKDLFKISLNELVDLQLKCINRFILRNNHSLVIDKNKILFETMSLNKRYLSFIKEIEIDKYKILKWD